jgi:hypothetical protein
LFHLTKNLTTHLSHNLCAVLPKKYKKTQLAPHTVQTMPSTGSTNAENAIPLPHGKASCCHYDSIRICCVAVIGGVHEKFPPVTLIKETLHKVRLPALYSVD